MYGENSQVFMIHCQDFAAEFPLFRDTPESITSLVHDLSVSSNYREDTVTLSLSCAPFVTGYGGIFRRSHSRGSIKAVEELGSSSLCPQQELAVKHFVCGNDVFVCLPTGSEKYLCTIKL